MPAAWYSQKKKKKIHFKIIWKSPHILRIFAKQCAALVAKSLQFKAAVVALSGHERSQP